MFIASGGNRASWRTDRSAKQGHGSSGGGFASGSRCAGRLLLSVFLGWFPIGRLKSAMAPSPAWRASTARRRRGRRSAACGRGVGAASERVNRSRRYSACSLVWRWSGPQALRQWVSTSQARKPSVQRSADNWTGRGPKPKWYDCIAPRPIHHRGFQALKTAGDDKHPISTCNRNLSCRTVGSDSTVCSASEVTRGG